MEFLDPRMCKLNTEIHYQLVQMTARIYSQYKTACVSKLLPALGIIKLINPCQLDNSKELFYFVFLYG